MIALHAREQQGRWPAGALAARAGASARRGGGRGGPAARALRARSAPRSRRGRPARRRAACSAALAQRFHRPGALARDVDGELPRPSLTTTPEIMPGRHDVPARAGWRTPRSASRTRLDRNSVIA